MKSILFVCCLLIVFGSSSFAQMSREEKLQQLKSTSDIKVTEIEKDILKIEYPHGKVLYKNICNYQPQTTNFQQTIYSPTYDSTIIDLTTIDTSLFYYKYSYWDEVPINNWQFDNILIGDVNNNGRPELYGPRKFFWSEQEPVTIYELKEYGNFDFKYQYDSVLISWNTYDVDNDGENDVHLGMGGTFGVTPDQRFFSRLTDTSLATQLSFRLIPYDGSYQVNDATLGDFDKNGLTDFLFARGAGGRDVHIFEYNPVTNSFDSVYRFAVYEEPPWANSGFSIGDFDLDGKTDIVFGTGKGAVYVLESEGNNQYTNSWLGMVETYHAYVHTWSNDIDGNGKPEFLVLGDAFYNGQAITRITLFETEGNNSYQVVSRIDLIGVFSFYAGTMQAVDIDDDGIDEIAVCIDDNFLILKFNGSPDHHTYEVYYIKQNEINTQDEFQIYYGATVYNLLDYNNREFEILISLLHIIVQPGEDLGRFVTKIYKPDSTSSVNNDGLFPKENKLYQNYPNPFNSATNVKFSLLGSKDVSIKVYNILGKEIKLLLDDKLPAGEYSVKWDGKDDEGNILPGGVYFIQMTAGNYRQTIKSVLLK